ncbi:MAG: MmgE/PrpD family protein [bacterium]
MDASKRLAQFASALRYDDLPSEVVRRTQALLLDWLGSALAGTRARPVHALRAVARDMGPANGASQIFATREMTSALFAATVNAAASHVVEQDDLHNQSVFHPATVVFPPVIAAAQAGDCSGEEVVAAAVAGYECGIRVGEFLGASHYRVFHTTATAGTLAAAMATANLLKLNPEQTLHALGNAGTQAAGLWEFLRDAADSKQLHAAKAAMDGMLAAYGARHGLTAATRILEGERGMAAGMLGPGADGDARCDADKITDRLGERWALLETSLKYHACCRHTHPAADALLEIRRAHAFDSSSITRITARVYQAAADVLGAVERPRSIHQSKFSMGFVLALIARHGKAGVGEFTETALADGELMRLHDAVEMVVDADIEARYPRRWSAEVEVECADGAKWRHRVDSPKGDPENPLRRDQIEDKFRALCDFGGAVDTPEREALLTQCWRLPQIAAFGEALLLAPRD